MTAPNLLGERLLIPLAEVAKRTGWSERSLLDDCRAGAIDHVNRRGNYSFTRQQVDALISRYTVVGSGEPLTAAQREADELEAARQFNAGQRGRSGRRAA
jgi:hypothetical protein